MSQVQFTKGLGPLLSAAYNESGRFSRKEGTSSKPVAFYVVIFNLINLLLFLLFSI